MMEMGILSWPAALPGRKVSLSAIGGMRPLDRDQWAVGCLFWNLEINRS